jgi:hypothetical protein
MNNEIKLYIYTIRKKILKLYIKIIFLNYKNIVSKDDANFFNINDLSFIDNNYLNIINRLINVIKFIDNIKNNQLGGDKKQKYSDEENEKIRQLKKKIDQLTKRIIMMQQQQMILNNNNKMSLYKAAVYQNALIQQNTNLTQCKADNEILTNDNSNLKEKILFFDKSLEILSKELDKNLSNGMTFLKTYEKIDTTPREHRTTVNIELFDKLSDVFNVKASIDEANGLPRRLNRSQTAGSDDSHSGDSDQSLHLSDKDSKQVNPLNFATLINNPN